MAAVAFDVRSEVASEAFDELRLTVVETSEEEPDVFVENSPVCLVDWS